MKLLHLAGALALAACFTILGPILAHAQAVAVDNSALTTVTIPVSEWVSASGTFVASILASLVVWLYRKLPAQIGDILKTMKVEQLLEKAVTYGINAVVGATKDKPLTINVGNQVVAQAVQYVISHGPAWLVSWMGGEAMIREKIIARLNLEADAELP